ncbi:EamA family transporter [Deltaproteobacteria bacterium Smac51]|nr:EamA family transporter [Deltaproteobacteria bacterium Smac51]
MNGILSQVRLSRQEWALVAVTMVWGTTFLIVHNVLDHTGPLFFVGIRFAFSSLAMLLISFRVMRGLTLNELWAGFAIGVMIFIGYGFQTFGLQTISSSKSAFITAFYIPLVPVFQWLFMRRRPHFMSWVGIFLALAGLILITGPQDGQNGLGIGEIQTFICTLGTTFEILLISHFAGKVDLRRVTVIQLMVASFLSFGSMGPMGESIPEFSWIVLGSAIWLGMMTAIIQLGMNWAQRVVSPARAAVIYAGEPVWAGIFGRMAGDRLPPAALIGCALVVIGVLVSELKPKFTMRRKEHHKEALNAAD